MLATLSLLGALLTVAPVDKVNFAHNFSAGQTVSYDFVIKGNGDGGAMEISSSFNLAFGDKADKGTNVTFSPKAMKMSKDGSAIDQENEVGDQKFVLDEHGMPDQITMGGPSAIVSVSLILAYLPNKELEVGDSFDINITKGDVTYKGAGKFEGLEAVNGKTLPKIKVKATLTPGSDGEGELDYSVYFDKESGHVSLVKGKAAVGSQEFTYTLTKK